MASPRVLGYDDLHEYIQESADTAYDMARDAADDQDESARRFYAGRASAFTDLLSHIEMELESPR